MTRLKYNFFILVASICLIAGTWEKSCAQVSYLGLDGGLEGSATIDNATTYAAPQTGKWAKANATQTITDETITVRSGLHSLRANNSSTTGRRVWSPNFTVGSTTSQVTIQFYRRGASLTNTQESQPGIINNTEGLSGTYAASSPINTWEKVTYTKASSTFTTISGVIMHRQLGTGGDMFIDDMCVYTGAVDVTASNAPTASVVGGATTSSLNVSWTAASGGIDGGGYLVVRGISDPTTTPNVNGIYAVGNTIAAGMTVVYQGTGTSFSDGSLASGTTYYYRIYTYDKAYNYSSALTGNGTTLNGSSPALTVAPTSLSGFTYIVGAGPSTSQSYQLSGINLTGFPSNITVTGSTNYEVSTNNSTFTSSVNIAYGSATLAATTIYVRLKSSLAVATYNGELITNAGGGATTVNVTCNGTVTNPSSSCATDLIFSEYVEGSASEKYIEIYNGSTSSINLADYKLQLYANGASTPTNDVALSGTLTSGSTIVYKNSASVLYPSATNNTACNFNGDDAVALYKISTAAFVDIIGEIGSDPGTEWGSGLTSTADNTLRRKATIFSGDVNGSDAYDPSVEWDGYATDVVAGLGSHTMSCGSTLMVVPASLTGFTYVFGSGPSASQSYALSGTNLSGFPGNITVTGSANFEVSLNNSTFSASVSIPYNSAVLASTNIYVRLKAGLVVGTYNGELVTNAGGGATTVNVTCNGTVTGPTLTASPTSLINLNYTLGSGPSAEQSFVLSGINLSAGPITVTAPTNFQVSLTSGSGFANSVSVAYTAPTLTTTTIYVRLVSGLAIGNYSGNITNSGGGASASVSLSGIVYDPAALPTVFTPGDLAIVGVNSNIKCIYADDGADEISFVSFKNINTGTTFYATDNGYQRVNPLKWGDTEGTYLITRTGGPIAAGTVITFRFLNNTPFMIFAGPDAGWTFTKVTGFGGNLVMNTNGDQIYLMQGGAWANGAGTHDATYTPGVYLFAFNTNSSWMDFGTSTQQSGLIPGMECFSMIPGVATDFIKFTSAVDGWSATSKRGWIDRINNPLNWTDCRYFPITDINFTTLSCGIYNSTAPDYVAGYSISITAGGFSPGVWTGSRNTDWFNCGNWQNMEVPDMNTNVVVPVTAVPNEPTIGDPPTVPVVYTGAECNDFTINSGHTLTMNHANSKLDVYGYYHSPGALSATNGVVNILDDNSNYNAGSPLTFYNLTINKTTPTSTFTLLNSFNVSNTLTLTSGIVVTGTNQVVVTNTAQASVTGHSINSYIFGNLRRNVASTGTYDFPVGTASNYELAQIIFNSSSGLTYIDASFSSPHVTPLNISALSLMVGGTLLEELLDYGYWTLTPNAGTYNYDVLLTSRGHTNPGAIANAHAVIKRPNSSSNWVSEGTHNNADQAMGAGWVTGVRRQLTVFSDFAIAKSLIGPLPVELLSFNAMLDGQDVFLNWSTASETNNNFFTVERSADGKIFENIGVVSGSGNSNTLLEYSMHDINPLSGINYYRLKQTDFDGKFSYSNVISISTDNNQGEAQLVANSAALELELYLNLSSEDKISVNIYDLSGKKIFSESIYSEPGLRSVHFRLPTMSNGIYLGEVIGKNLIVKQKFVY